MDRLTTDPVQNNSVISDRQKTGYFENLRLRPSLELLLDVSPKFYSNDMTGRESFN
jgi:hypothetical protein